MERKRLRVDGIPTDIPVERAKDKLTIHFLRTRNGGGEVEDIEIVSGPPSHAIITFEDDKVIESVLKIKNHSLKIKDKTYNLRVSKLPGKLKLDEILKKASISVNYKILPEKLEYILKSLRKTYKDVKFEFDEKSKICEISGSYTKINTLSQEIINKCSLKEDSSDTQGQTDQSTCRKHFVPQVGDHTSLGQYASSEQARFFSRGKTAEELQEPFVWDSDIFRYMQKFHSQQYKELLNKNNVQAFEESSDEITTIIVQPLHGDKDCVTNLRDAQINLMGLYQGLEQCLRKEQIDKRDWYGNRDIYRTLLKELKSLFPMLLCHENDQYLFLIGSSGDVALGKQHITDSQLKFNNPTSSLHTYNMQSTRDQLSTAAGQRDLMPLSFKLDSNENKEGSRIAAMFSPPPGSSSFLKSHLDEKYLSSNSNNKQNNDLECPPGSKTIDYAFLAHLNTAEESNFSQVNEKSGSKGLAQIKKMDVLPALKTGRVDISKSNTKNVGKIQPLRISKASSKFAFSGLVDTVPQSLDFKPAEVKLRRSSSFSNVYAKDTSEHQDGTAQFKEEIPIEDWLWHYMKEFHKSDIDTWCAEVTLTEEKHKEVTVLKLKANNKSKLWSVMKCVLLTCKEKRDILNKCYIEYSILGAKGPDDTAAIEEWCGVFQKCSKELCIKLEKEKMLLIYPKVAEKSVEGYSNLLNRKNKYSDSSSLVSGGQPSLVTVTKEEGKEPEYSGQHGTESYVTYLDKNYLESLEEFRSTFIKFKEGQKNKVFPEDNAAFRSFYPALQSQDFQKSNTFVNDPNRPKSKISDLDNYQAGVYGSSLPPTMDSSSDFSEMRRPAVGQESNTVNRVCDHCKSDGRASTLACGHFLCDNCHSAFKDSCCVCRDQIAHGNRSSLNATMTCSSMTLSLPGYDRNTSFKIKYEVPNGIQGAEDPHPGRSYTGATFEAFLPDNTEGKKLLSLLEKALNQNLTFKVKSMGHEDVVTWHKIPHKTSTTGGIPKKGYPDSQYIKNTLDILRTFGIE